MEKKITKAMMFIAIANYFGNGDALPDDISQTDVINFCEHEIELLAKRASADHKPTAKQTANDSIRPLIVDILMDSTDPMSVTEVTTALNANGGTEYSVQKINALMAQMVKLGTIIRTEVKRKAYFSVAGR